MSFQIGDAQSVLQPFNSLDPITVGAGPNALCVNNTVSLPPTSPHTISATLSPTPINPSTVTQILAPLASPISGSAASTSLENVASSPTTIVTLLQRSSPPTAVRPVQRISPNLKGTSIALIVVGVARAVLLLLSVTWLSWRYYQANTGRRKGGDGAYLAPMHQSHTVEPCICRCRKARGLRGRRTQF